MPANNKDIAMKIKLSQSQWKEIGTKMGWLKTAQEDDSWKRTVPSKEEIDSDTWKHMRNSQVLVRYELTTMEGMPLSSGRFMAVNPYDIQYILNERLQGKAFGPYTPIKMVLETNVKPEAMEEYEYWAYGDGDVKVGIVTVKRDDGKPFTWFKQEKDPDYVDASEQ